MNSIFFECVNSCLKQTIIGENYSINFSESILFDRFQDQIVVLDFQKIKLGIVLERNQVQLLISSNQKIEWFDLSSITYYLSNGNDDWVFESLVHPVSTQNIINQIHKMFEKYEGYYEKIISFFSYDNDYDLRINKLKRYMNKRWKERSIKYKP